MSDEAKPDGIDEGSSRAKILAFKRAGKAVESLTPDERAAVLRALCLLHEVKL